jgi:hypothetical protein
LSEVEAVVRAADQAPSLEALCTQHRLDIELPGALRWVRRRGQDAHSALHRIKGVLEGTRVLHSCTPAILSLLAC